MTPRSQHACFGGQIGFFEHNSEATGTAMRFAVFVPPQAKQRKCPALYYLAGLTCTEETFPIKAGAQALAAEHGLVLVAPDTSPRGAGIAGRRRWLGFRHRRRVLPRRDRRAVVVDTTAWPAM